MERKAGTTKSYLSDAYLQLVSTTNALVTIVHFPAEAAIAEEVSIR